MKAISFFPIFIASTVLTLGSFAQAQAPLTVGDWVEKNGPKFGIYPDAIDRGAMKERVDQLRKQDRREKIEGENVRLQTVPSQVVSVIREMNYAPACHDLVSDRGLGDWGTIILQELLSGAVPALMSGSSDLVRACPNYPRLEAPARAMVWLTAMTSMFFFESTCNPHAVGQGPNGKAVGLAQLHQGHEGRYAPNCNDGDSRTVEGTVRCTLSILNQQIVDVGALFWEKTHFGVLRPQGDLIRMPNGRMERVVIAKGVIGALKALPLCSRSAGRSTR